MSLWVCSCLWVDTKRSEGTINVDFKLEKLTDMISPRKIMDAIRQKRKELQYMRASMPS